jgi:gamma-glutamyltranspeptidase/glutathione hydrolase
MTQISMRSRRGMVVAPDARAAQAGQEVLADGGNAVEAAVAAAATLAVVYPHMCGLGGDSFWLIANGRKNAPQVIDASGAAAASLTHEHYTSQGYQQIPERGPQAALTMAGTVSGMEAALRSYSGSQGKLPLERLLAPAIEYAQQGFTPGQHLQSTLDTRCHNAVVPEPGNAPGGARYQQAKSVRL